MWMLTTLAQTPAQHHPPILAVEAVAVTASFFILAIREISPLATTVILLAQFLCFRQVAASTRARWWNPSSSSSAPSLELLVADPRRALLPDRALGWLQGIAAAVAGRDRSCLVVETSA